MQTCKKWTAGKSQSFQEYSNINMSRAQTKLKNDLGLKKHNSNLPVQL